MNNQFGSAPSDVPGFRYFPSFVSEADHRELLSFFATVAFRTFKMRGQVAGRTVCCFGFDYVYVGQRVVPTEPMPKGIERLCRDVEALVADDTNLCQAIVTRYPPKTGINWHKDAPVFGPSVVGVSFGSAARLHLKRGTDVRRIVLEPRSVYVLTGPARFEWLHRIAPVANERYSVTFRSIAAAR